MKENYNVSIEVVGHEKGIKYGEDLTILFKIECKVNNELKETFFIGSDDVNQKHDKFIELIWDRYRWGIDNYIELDTSLLFSNENAFTTKMHKLIQNYCIVHSVPPYYLSEDFNEGLECYPVLAEAIYMNIMTNGNPYINEFNIYNKHMNIKWTYENSILRLSNIYLNAEYELKEPTIALIGPIAVDFNKRFNSIIDGNYDWSL